MTSANENLRAPIPLRPRSAPRIMIAPSATGMPIASSQGAQIGVPLRPNAPAYPTAIAAMAANKATSARRRVIAEQATRRSPASVRPYNPLQHMGDWPTGAFGLLRARPRGADRHQARSARSNASTTLD